jgi:hypothetical protein
VALAFLVAIAGVVVWAVLRPIAATYVSRCPICDESIDEGDEIVSVDGDWVHAFCAEDEGYEVGR